MRKYCGALAIVVVMSMAMFTGAAYAGAPEDWHGNGDRPNDPGAYLLSQAVMYGEKVVKDGVNYGIYMDGTLVSLDDPYYNSETGSYWDMTWQDSVSVEANWSDDLVLHEWDYGDKIRTEVILQCVEDSTVSVFTISASFLIEYKVGDVWTEVWSGTTLEGLWADGPTDAYSAEVNQVGVLLFGYNWDTDSLEDEIAVGPGQYRLTFTLNDISGELPVYTEYVDDVISAKYPIEYSTITIAETVDDVLYPENFLDGIGHDLDSTWIEITLL